MDNLFTDTKQQITGKTANEMFHVEKDTLIQCPPRLSCYEEKTLRVDKYATVSYRTNRYSVPDHLVGHFIEARIMSHQIHIYADNLCQAKHDRNFGKHQWIISIEHYLATSKQKPGAVKGSTALASNRYLKSLYNDFFTESPRDFIELLTYCHKHLIEGERLETTVKRLLDCGVKHITTEQLTALLGNKSNINHQYQPDLTIDLAKQQLSQITALLN